MKLYKSVISALALGLVVLSCHGQDPTNVRVQNVLKKLVASNNREVVGLGSWISGKKYNDPLTGGTSDHDMRLLLPQGTPPENALAEWRATQAKLKEMVKAEFGKDADRVLSTINLYPPTQLVQGVEDGADAAAGAAREAISAQPARRCESHESRGVRDETQKDLLN